MKWVTWQVKKLEYVIIRKPNVKVIELFAINFHNCFNVSPVKYY